MYLGDPPWSQVSIGLLTTRLLGWAWLHCNILFPAIAALAWSVRTRNPAIIAAYVACIPWAVLHLLAVSDLAGLMFGYYAYPFLIAMAWPWLAVLIRHRQQTIVTVQPIAAAAWMLAVVALSLLPVGGAFDPGRITFPEAFLRSPSATQQMLSDRADRRDRIRTAGAGATRRGHQRGGLAYRVPSSRGNPPGWAEAARRRHRGVPRGRI